MMLNTMRNRAFTQQLPAWVCDSVSMTMLMSMLPYYIRYNVQPEGQTGGSSLHPDCAWYTGEDYLDGDWKCDSTMVLSITIVVVLVAAAVFIPVWNVLVARLDKYKAWLVWSFSMALTNFALCFLPRAQDSPLGVYGMVLVGALNGAPVADTIDYDEFLSGQRNEATYTMFRSFLPKICAIPAGALPLAILNAIGHVPPENGLSHPDNDNPTIRAYVVIVAGLVPSLFQVASAVYKLGFPRTTRSRRSSCPCCPSTTTRCASATSSTRSRAS